MVGVKQQRSRDRVEEPTAGSAHGERQIERRQLRRGRPPVDEHAMDAQADDAEGGEVGREHEPDRLAAVGRD